MSFIYSMADTWNAGGTTFNSILMNVTNGAGGAPVGAAASKILNLQNNAVSVLNTDVNGIGNTNKWVVGSAVTAAGVVPVTDFEVHNTTGLGLIFNYAWIANSTGTNFSGNKSRGATIGTQTIVQANDVLVTFGGLGSDGTAFRSAGFLQFLVDGAPGASSMPGRAELRTTPTGTTTAVIRQGWDALGNVFINTAAIATTATDGFLHIPTCAGQPTGVPTLKTGLVPMIFDTTNSQFWFYTGGAWKQPKTPAGAAIVTWQ